MKILIDEATVKLALEALESGVKTQANSIAWMEYDSLLIKNAITAIKEALAQPDYRAVKTYHEGKPVYVAQSEQEPVAHLWQHGETGRTRIVMPDQIITADANWFVVGPLILGTSPPQPHQEQNLNCKSTQARLATAWGYTKVLDISDKRLMEMPPQRPWVGLTDEEALDCWPGLAMYADCVKFWENIEAKLREKNK